jgi:hypothetical protein
MPTRPAAYNGLPDEIGHPARPDRSANLAALARTRYAVGVLFARIRHGRPRVLALRVLALRVLALRVLAAALRHRPAHAPPATASIATWLALTIGAALARPPAASRRQPAARREQSRLTGPDLIAIMES